MENLKYGSQTANVQRCPYCQQPVNEDIMGEHLSVCSAHNSDEPRGVSISGKVTLSPELKKQIIENLGKKYKNKE